MSKYWVPVRFMMNNCLNVQIEKTFPFALGKVAKFLLPHLVDLFSILSCRTAVSKFIAPIVCLVLFSKFAWLSHCFVACKKKSWGRFAGPQNGISATLIPAE